MILRALASKELPLIPAAPESAMPDRPSQPLPDSAPPAPWDCTLDAYLWVQRAGEGAGWVVPQPLRWGRPPRWIVGAFARYTDSPVGPYSEVYAALVVRHGTRLVTHVPFMAVDSMASLRGGRANWALPKTTATFEGQPSGSEGLGAAGAGWQVTLEGSPFGRRLPMTITLKMACAQVCPDGTVARFSTALSGRPRLARVDVEVASDASLPLWMPSGRHLAMQWSNSSLHVDAAVAQPS